MQLEKNRTNILEWDFFWLQRFCLPRPQRSGWFQGKLCDSSLAPAMKNEGKMIMTAYSPPLICPSLPSGGHESAVDVQSYILSHITILRFIQTIWFLDCLILQSYDSCEQFDFCGVFCYTPIDYFQQFDFFSVLYNNPKDSYWEFDFCNVSCYNPIIHTKN